MDANIEAQSSLQEATRSLLFQMFEKFANGWLVGPLHERTPVCVRSDIRVHSRPFAVNFHPCEHA